MYYLLAGFLGFLLSGVWFGIQLWLTHIFFKKGCNYLTYFSPLFAACIPIVLITYLNGYSPNLGILSNEKLWVLTATTLLVTCLIKGLSEKKHQIAEKQELAWICMEAAFVEIAQRLMMQSFVMYLLDAWGCATIWCIFLNALIWCAGIVTQGGSLKEDNWKKFCVRFDGFICFFCWLRICILPIQVHCFFGSCACGWAIYYDKTGAVIRRRKTDACHLFKPTN